MESPIANSLIAVPLDDNSVDLSRGVIAPMINLLSLGCHDLSDGFSINYRSVSGIKVNV